MHELTRMAYLEAMGIDGYVSRHQLPGAAPTRRLALVPVAATPVAKARPAMPDIDPGPSVRPVQMPRLEESGRPGAASPGQEQVPADLRQDASTQAVIDRFSLVAMTVGGLLWVEELDQPVLATEQVKLVHAMARAVAGKVAAPLVQQFDWPLHNNRQLDLGEEAARASVAGFLQRQLDQQDCSGLVLLGEGSRRRVSQDLLGPVQVVQTLDTLSLLAQPQLKKQAWRDLQSLVSGN